MSRAIQGYQPGVVVDQSIARPAVRDSLQSLGFRLIHESTAVAIFVHSRRPGIIVRIGTTQIVAEESGEERFRSKLSEFDVEQLEQTLGVTTTDC